MKKNEKDTFEVNIPALKADNNFFLSAEDVSFPSPVSNVSEPARRLNDYDFNLLREDAYKDVSDDLFKLEYKISRIEDEIKSVDSQLFSAKEIQDFYLIEDLTERKRILTEDYEALVAIYNEKSLSAKISDKILNIFGSKMKLKFNDIRNRVSIVSEKLVSVMPKQFASVLELRKSLAKLENLNKSVDELMALNIPYGENINKYEQLSKYIIKANSIQAEISRYMKEK